MTARDVIVTALSGIHVDDGTVTAFNYAINRILSDLTAAGYSIVHESEIHGATLQTVIRLIKLGEYPRPVGMHYRADKAPSKYDRCIHDIGVREDCEYCLVAALRALPDGGVE